MKTTLSSNLIKPVTTAIAASRNPKSGSKVAAQTNGHESAKWAGRWSNLAADHVKRWEKRLYVPTSGHDGDVVEGRRLAVRIQHLGRREEFRFDTTNRQAAAIQALDVFRFLKANGWPATLAKYKPEVQTVKLNATIGDYLAAVRDTNRLRSRTFLNYQNALRTIAAEAFTVKLDKGASKFDYRSGNREQSGRATWIGKIDAHKLGELTLEKVTDWKRKRVAQAGHSPAAIASAKRTVNSYIRCARSLFAPGVIREVKGLTLPDKLPFAGVELEETGSTKYVSKINAQILIAAAKRDLKTNDPEAYKAFLLGLFAGLRKAEIDSLEWRMIDFSANLIRLEQTEWLHLKTDDSAAEITADPEVLVELRAMIPKPTDKPAQWKQFVLVGHRPPRPESPRPYYRCEETFERLNAWLRSKGITANKPLHELRKELGALIATEQGIYAASRFLRHSDISTTARHYADHKARICVGLGKYLDTSAKPVQQSVAA
jgi:integrase